MKITFFSYNHILRIISTAIKRVWKQMNAQKAKVSFYADLHNGEQKETMNQGYCKPLRTKGFLGSCPWVGWGAFPDIGKLYV